MRLEHLELTNFRKFNNIKFSFPERTLIVGPNGAGKTTLVEACAVVLGGRSFRTTDLRECIGEGGGHFFVRAEVTLGGLERSVFTNGLDRKGQKKLTRDGQSLPRRSLLSSTSFVLCTYEDIEMVSGSPKKRRDFLDRAAMGRDRRYIDTITRYLRYLKQKTALLKSGKKSGLAYLNEAAVPLIVVIRHSRQEAAARIAAHFAEVARQAGLGLSVAIESPDEGEGEVRRRLRERTEKEIERRLPLYGPHLDDVRMVLTGRVAKTSSSGEVAFGAFCLRLAETLLLAEAGWPPLFIGDEIFSFMDRDRRERAGELLAALPFQTIVTSLRPPGEGKVLKECSLISLEK